MSSVVYLPVRRQFESDRYFEERRRRWIEGNGWLKGPNYFFKHLSSLEDITAEELAALEASIQKEAL